MTPDEFVKESENAVATVMSTAIGRRFVMIILEGCNWGHPTFSNEPTAMAYNAGIDAIGKALWSKIEDLQPEQALQMLKEDRQRKDDFTPDEG